MSDLFHSIRQTVATLLPRRVKNALHRMVPDALPTRMLRRSWLKSDIHLWPPEGTDGASDLHRYEYSFLSQNGEDGIIRWLFDQIGFRTRTFLEFGFSAGENNSLRLMMKERFGGLFIDANERQVRHFHKVAQGLGINQVKAANAFLTLENLEPTIQKEGLEGEIDFMSIDVDGNDYWFWEKLAVVRPRVACIEFNSFLGPDVSVSMPYDPTFDRFEKHPYGAYFGASLKAMENLGKRKGYRLVACDSNGINAFFLDSNCSAAGIKTKTAEEAYVPFGAELPKGVTRERLSADLRNFPFETIS